MTNFAEVINIKVDLDEGRSVKEGAPPNKHRVLIKKTGSINLVAIESYLGGKLQFDNKVLEAISKAITNIDDACTNNLKTFSTIF